MKGYLKQSSTHEAKSQQRSILGYYFLILLHIWHLKKKYFGLIQWYEIWKFHEN